jgi:AGZA family xanthine/uracil permease-like MFS transporter
MDDALAYLPVVVPFALATVVGGIDCTESAAAAGDEYHTGQVIGVEAIAAIAAAVCGGVIQTTPYIGHPAYKAMGGRAAYTLAAALFVGGAGLLGYFSQLYAVIPKAAVFPILIFIGLEITAQSFLATPRRHYTAVALACIPALAVLVTALADPLVALATSPSLGVADLDQIASRNAELALNLQVVRTRAAGFIVTSLIWAAALAMLIDRRMKAAAAYFATAGVLSLFGVIHSPLPGSPIGLPWRLPPLPQTAAGVTPYHLAAGYAAMAVVVMLWSWFCPPARIISPQSEPLSEPLTEPQAEPPPTGTDG